MPENHSPKTLLKRFSKLWLSLVFQAFLFWAGIRLNLSIKATLAELLRRIKERFPKNRSGHGRAEHLLMSKLSLDTFY